MRFFLCSRPVSLLRHHPRLFSSASVLHNAIDSSVQLKEWEDVSAMDKLLKVVRTKSDPTYHQVVPVRAKGFWADCLLNSANLNHASASSQPPEQLEIPAERPMSDSYSEILLPFGSSPELLEQYINAAGRLRVGLLMEHLDSLAGSISYKHMLGPAMKTTGKISERGFYIVTASVDRLDMLSDPSPNEDLRLSGQVIYTGNSSMEVAVRMESVTAGKEKTVLLGRFSMVCRDAVTHSARPVPKLSRNMPEEQTLWDMGESIKRRRSLSSQQSLLRVPPTSKEAEALHAFYLHSQKDEDPRRMAMRKTRIESTRIMFPQERNIHSKIFGGYLMRLAYELGYANAVFFSRRPRVQFLSLDGISFAKPVPIGSILQLDSQVIHSRDNLVHVAVKADVLDAVTGSSETTNEFRLTWCAEGEPLKHVVTPTTYKEAMLWVEGKRALDIGEQIRGYIRAEAI